MVVYHWRLVAGSHIETNLEGTEGNYNQGDRFWSKNDLSRFNTPGSTKFELIEKREAGETEVLKLTPAPDPILERNTGTVQGLQDFQAMSVAELQAWAKENEIPLNGAKNKDAIIKVIEGILKG